MSCHDQPATVTLGQPRFALVGSPNVGKTTLFNALTGLRAKTGNYPGVTVAKYEGTSSTPAGEVTIEDLPGTYSLDPIGPDEQIVSEVLSQGSSGDESLAGAVVLLDANNLRRSLGLLAQLQQTATPICVALTFTDELSQRGGSLDVTALSRAIGVKVVPVTAGDPRGVQQLREALSDPDSWPAPIIAPPTQPAELSGWLASVLDAAHYRAPGADLRTRRIDKVLLHPIWGSLVFFVTMFLVFQIIFTVAAPAQDALEGVFVWLGDIARSQIPIGWLASLIGDGILAGVGGVVVFLPQIALLFLLISILEGTGYLARAAYLMDRVMAMAGLEGRAFVALLSSLACAIPGIMATRTLPSARDRIATMMAAPLMTCSARLPVYILLIGLLVPSELRWGPIGAQGAIMFGLYLLGAVSAMTVAWAFKKILGRGQTALPFYLELPPYRIPSLRTVALSVWEACLAFLRKVATIIMATTIILWVLMSFPLRSEGELVAHGIDTTDDVAVSAYVLDNSYAADVGRFVSPVFEPLGFDWRINVGILSSLAAREVFVSTLGQVAAAEDPEDPGSVLHSLKHDSGPQAGEPVFTPPTIAALLVFFVYAMQCMSTLGVMRRETGTWRWSIIAFGYCSVLAWTMAFLAHTLTGFLL